MTDARYPERWLNDRRVQRLSDAAHRLFVIGLVWSAANRTDGVIADEDLAWLPGVDTGCTGELSAAGVWLREREGNSWLMVDFAETQTTRAQLEAAAVGRAAGAERQRRYRERHRDSERDVTQDVTGDVTRDVTRESTRTGQDRTGQEEGTGDGDVSQALGERCPCGSTAGLLVGADGVRRCRRHHFEVLVGSSA